MQAAPNRGRTDGPHVTTVAVASTSHVKSPASPSPFTRTARCARGGAAVRRRQVADWLIDGHRAPLAFPSSASCGIYDLVFTARRQVSPDQQPGLLLSFLDVLQTHGQRGIVLERDHLVLHIRHDAGGNRHLAFACAAVPDVQFDQRERIVD